MRASLLKVPNVKAVVPMGISGALVTSGNTIDLALEKLRNAVKRRRDARSDADRASADAQVAAEKGHVRQIVSVLQGDLKNASTMLDARAIDKDDAAAVARAASDQFWAGFDKDPFESLEFLENRIANQAADADLLFLRYVGTDFQAFQKSFDRMKIVEGTTVPPGKRGFLFAKHVYEEQLKLKAARRLDQIKEGLDSQGQTIATTPDLERMVRENVSQVREILLQLDAAKTAISAPSCSASSAARRPTSASCWRRSSRPTTRTSTSATTSSTRSWRRRWSCTACGSATSSPSRPSRVGYVQSVNVPVYGTFQFQGLEKSTLAGALNLMDLVSFRELYGFLSGEKLAEVQALQKAAGAHDVSRENAEAELFGTQAPRSRPTRRRAGSTRRPRPASRRSCATSASRWAASCSARRRAAGSSRPGRSRAAWC